MTLESEESQSKVHEGATETHTLSVPLGGWWRLALAAATAFALTFGAALLMARIFIPLALLLFAIVIAEALSPVIGWLQRWVPRGLAIVIVYVVLLLITGALAWLVLPPVVQQISQGAGQVPSEVKHFENYVTRKTGLSHAQLASGMTNLLNRLAGQFGSLPIRVVRDMFDVLLVYFLSIYWLFVSPQLKTFVISLFPRPRQHEVERVLREMGHDMGGYLRGSVISGAITGGLAFGGLLLIHVNYALALGALTFFGELIPVIGVIVVGALVVIVALFQSLTHALLALAVYSVILFLESHLLAPNIMRSQTTVSQVLVLFALVAGFEIGGILGALVAIPLSAGLRVLVIRVFAPGIRQWSGAEPPPGEQSHSPPARSNGRAVPEGVVKTHNLVGLITRVVRPSNEAEEWRQREETS